MMRKGRFAGLSVAPNAAPGTPAWRRALSAGLVLGAPAGMLAAVSIGGPHLVLPAAVGATLIAWLGINAVRPALEQAEPDAASVEAASAERVAADFEASGCGWFWVSDVEGRLNYVSPALAASLGVARDALMGRQFGEILITDGADIQLPTLEFHLASRFPFTNLIVTAASGSEQCWSLSGSPCFDEVGRFMGFRGVGLNLTEDQRAEVRSSRVAACDGLTGLPNRTRMRAMLDEALRNSDSRREGCALFLIDLDRFKQVNDTLGHPVGDLLLQEVAVRLNAELGEAGQLGRLGGDEFEAVLPGIDEEGCLAEIAERMISRVSAPYVIRGNPVSIGASIGIAISRPGRTVADDLIKSADLALYASKAAGRGTYRFFEAAMHSEETERRVLESDLRGALASGQFRLVFQPVVAASSDDVVGLEALLRWLHPTRGRLAPEAFLGQAEAARLIGQIGEWVLRTACAEAAKWPDHIRLSVNLSLAEVEQPHIVAHVASALAASGLEPDRLELDLPEAALLTDNPQVRSTLSSLKELGVRLALDDFGLASASVSTLRSPLLDRVKLHSSLVRGAGVEGSRCHAVVASLVSVSTDIGLEVTAEGVESLEDLALGRRLGCTHVQGFLVGRPVEPEEAAQLAAASQPVAVADDVGSRPPRHSLIRRGSLSFAGETRPVRLRNISAEGAMIESDQPMVAGEQVELDLSDGVRLSGEVRWAQDGRIGLRFAEKFDLKRLGRSRRATPSILRPDYLSSELDPNSPWASRRDKFSVQRKSS